MVLGVCQLGDGTIEHCRDRSSECPILAPVGSNTARLCTSLRSDRRPLAQVPIKLERPRRFLCRKRRQQSLPPRWQPGQFCELEKLSKISVAGFSVALSVWSPHAVPSLDGIIAATRSANASANASNRSSPPSPSPPPPRRRGGNEQKPKAAPHAGSRSLDLVFRWPARAPRP